MSITFDRSDDMPDPLATFKTIADITEDDIEALITKIEDLEDSL